MLKGGFPIYGQDVGIIMLECAFPRPVGDIGNARSFPFPVRYEVLSGISAARLTTRDDPAAVARLIRAAERLERHGARIILTSCGLFLRHQARLAAAVKVPVATSAVLLVPFLAALLPPHRKIAILTANAPALGATLARMGWRDAERVVVAGMEKCAAFGKAVLAPASPYTLDPERVQRETVSVAKRVLKREPTLGAILLECTNLAPYSRGLRKALDLPVFDVIGLARLLHGAAAE